MSKLGDTLDRIGNLPKEQLQFTLYAIAGGMSLDQALDASEKYLHIEHVHYQEEGEHEPF